MESHCIKKNSYTHRYTIKLNVDRILKKRKQKNGNWLECCSFIGLRNIIFHSFYIFGIFLNHFFWSCFYYYHVFFRCFLIPYLRVYWYTLHHFVGCVHYFVSPCLTIDRVIHPIAMDQSERKIFQQ